MRYKFQHFLDISTSASSMQLIKIKAGGEYVRQRCKHLFNTYKYFKLGRISVKLVPASTLPVDPLGLSLNASDPQTVDPRDQLNPGLVRITNGEDLLEDFTGASAVQQESMYQATMLDPRWSKFMLQSGFRRSAYPLYWSVGNLHQSAYPDAIVNLPNTHKSGNYAALQGTYFDQHFQQDGIDNPMHVSASGSKPQGLFQVGHKNRIGWLPTDAFEKFFARDKDGDLSSDNLPFNNPIPSIDCITVVLPKAYKTLFYYRLFITEEVFFSGIKNVGLDGLLNEYRAIDNFTHVPWPIAKPPFSPVQDFDTSNDRSENDGRSSP